MAATPLPVRILLVEDNPGDAVLLEELLLDAPTLGLDVSVDHVERMRDAVDRLTAVRPDVILLDLDLPDSRGIDTLQRVRTAATDTPIVVLSGDATPEIAIDALQDGAQDYLVKGTVDTERLVRAMRYAMERERLRRALSAAEGAARTSSEAKSRFLAVMSHELRTPLGVIVGFAELLADGLCGPVTAEQVSHLARIRVSAEHLLVIIEDMLQLSRMEAGREQARTEPVRVSQIVHEVAGLLDPSANAKGLTFLVEESLDDLVIATDPIKLRQILVNLVGNAVKFTDAGRVTLRVRADDATVTLDVEDTGIGIAPADVALIFEPFWQVDQRERRRVGGTGLGLDVSLRLARLLGGDLSVRSMVGRGSTFTLTLPR